MKNVFVDVGKGYEIFIQRGLIQNCGEYVKKAINAKRLCVVTDSNVCS